jgi:hypothetical protein
MQAEREGGREGGRESMLALSCLCAQTHSSRAHTTLFCHADREREERERVREREGEGGRERENKEREWRH